ncbi:putative ORFan [Cotonvirus japonicus]|uniref:ORFan n=1 Tax=Cotonvirus japonicus TaxID=2811091 RepID=A0ABM7NUC0_9VIRU|nr:putative ORFan [Cotonvirus japonicus]BCS83780.1 putative ORFan [Cotonvirus japonicus]
MFKLNKLIHNIKINYISYINKMDLQVLKYDDLLTEHEDLLLQFEDCYKYNDECQNKYIVEDKNKIICVFLVLHEK